MTPKQAFSVVLGSVIVILLTINLSAQQILFQYANIAFDANDPLGSPQIWQLSLKPYNISEVTNQGTPNQPIVEPTWSNVGWIAYQYGASGVRGLHVIQFHGTDLGVNDVELKKVLPEDDDRDPSWSPDGRYIVYSRHQNGGSTYDLWIYDTKDTPWDTSDDTQCQLKLDMNAGTLNLRPAWSPDSQTIAFMTSGGSVGSRSQVALVPFQPFDPTNCSNNQAHEVTLLTDAQHDNGINSHPTWSPDSKSIAFSSTRSCDNGCGGHTLFEFRDVSCGESDDCQPDQLTNASANDTNPAWSKDGTTIAFSSDRDQGHKNLWTITRAGESKKAAIQITHGTNNDDDPSWQADHRAKQGRPIMLGASGFNINDCNAGTLGVLVQDTTDGVKYILSNNHVLALSNQGKQGQAIVQPGTYDWSPPNCQNSSSGNGVANLSLFQQIQYCNPNCFGNVVDAAIAQVKLGKVDDTGLILDIGHMSRDVENNPSKGELVKKSGRTTLLTRGMITGLDGTIHVKYGNQDAKFVNQIMFSRMSLPGDSGSLIVTDTNPPKAVALLFAGGKQVTWGNPIESVLTNPAFGNLCIVDSTGQCIDARLTDSTGFPDPEVEKVRKIKDKYDDYLLSLPGVLGHVIAWSHNGSGKPVILIFVREYNQVVRQSLPRSIDGISIELKEVGDNPWTLQ
jgi:Tol biopolymer transport system component